MDHIFVLYDRTSDSVWYPLNDGTLDAVAGEHRGDAIPILDEPAPIALSAWLEDHPNSDILLPTAEEAEFMERMTRAPYMGVQLEENDEGLFIVTVVEGTPAAKASLEDGDEIRNLAGEPIATREDLRDIMAKYEAGDTISVIVRRGGRNVELNMTLGSRADAR